MVDDFIKRQKLNALARAKKHMNHCTWREKATGFNQKTRNLEPPSHVKNTKKYLLWCVDHRQLLFSEGDFWILSVVAPMETTTDCCWHDNTRKGKRAGAFIGTWRTSAGAWKTSQNVLPRAATPRRSRQVAGQCPRKQRAILQASLEPLDATTPSLPIIVGSISLALPFFIAAILFGERIVRQRRCPTCKGSGLIHVKSKFYKRCPT